MQTVKTRKISALPLAVFLFSMTFFFYPGLHGQNDQTKKGQSYDGSNIDMDSLFESLRNNFGISPFADDDFFNRLHEQHPDFHMFRWHGQSDPDTENDSLYGYINPEDSIYFFNKPYDFFERFQHRDPFDDSLFDEFFNDRTFGHDQRDRMDSDLQDMMENHRKMMEEMQKYFQFHMPCYPLKPDSVPHNPLQQKYHTPSKPLPMGQEI
jgi:hypothetical protein